MNTKLYHLTMIYPFFFKQEIHELIKIFINSKNCLYTI